ncbi:MAG: hypothetical protein FP826_09305 [Sphingomonadales bacterium]|nr:hypothetical protein [Sphingomonadales bacterium]MBU3991564.1 hypothetical protein [Alphaproteobacteria bacterium]
MAVESAADLAGMFDSEEFAEGARYIGTEPGAVAVPCLPIIDRGQGRESFRAGEQSARTSERKLWVQAAELPEVKRDGTFITDLGETFRVAGLPQLDHTAGLWSADLLLVD